MQVSCPERTCSILETQTSNEAILCDMCFHREEQFSKGWHLSQIAGIMDGFLDEVTPKLNLEL